MRPIISLSFYADFLNAQGIARARLVRNQRIQREQKEDRSWSYYYREIIRALFAEISTAAKGVELDLAVSAAPSRKEASFRAVAAGIKSVLNRRRPRRIEEAPVQVWDDSNGDARIRIAPHAMVTYADGQKEVWFLHFKDTPLERTTANVLLYLMRKAYEGSGIEVVPVVVNVRTAAMLRTLSTADDALIAQSLEIDCETYGRYWDSAAA